MNIEDAKKTFKPSEVAKELELNHMTILRWIREGRIKAIKTFGGQYKIPVEEVIRVKEEMGYGS